MAALGNRVSFREDEQTQEDSQINQDGLQPARTLGKQGSMRVSRLFDMQSEDFDPVSMHYRDADEQDHNVDDVDRDGVVEGETLTGDPLSFQHDESHQTSNVKRKLMAQEIGASIRRKIAKSQTASVIAIHSQRIVSHRWFERISIIMIFLDILALSLLQDSAHNEIFNSTLLNISLFLTLLFVIELVLRVLAHLTVGFDWMLLFEAIVVAASAADVLISYFVRNNSAHRSSLFFLRPVRGFRILRGFRLLLNIAQQTKGPAMVFDVLFSVGKPLAFIQIIIGSAVLGAAIMVTVQVPPVIDELDQLPQNNSHVRELVLNQFGGVWKSTSTLLEAVLGSVDLGPTCIMVFQSVPAYNIPTGWFLSTLLMSILLLRLMTLGLVGGVFLSQLVYIKGESQLEVGGEAFRKNQIVMFTLDEAFTNKGYDTSDHIEWDDVVDVMKELKNVGVAEEDAKAAFDELDVAGPVCLEDFISAVFKNHSTAKSVSKMTQDHQQVKVHARVKLYGSFMHKSLKHLQERVWEVKSLLPEMIETAKGVAEQLEKLDTMEEHLTKRRRDVWELAHGGSKDASGVDQSQKASFEETLLHSELNDELKDLEAEIQSLLNSPLPEADSEQALDAFADELIGSFMQSTSEEMKRAAKNGHINDAREKHAAVVLIKSHVVNDKVKNMVREKLEFRGLRVMSESEIVAADPTQPRELQLGADMEAAFEKHFSISWRVAVGETKQPEGLGGKAQVSQVEETLVYNALDAASKLNMTPAQLSARYNSLQEGDIFKFGDGFTCCKLNNIYVINVFHLSTNTYCYTVEWDARRLSWRAFYDSVVGSSEGSILRLIRSRWKDFDLKAPPSSGDSCVHASASPFQALAERCYWLRASVNTDLFGKALLAEDIPHDTIIQWLQNPTIDSVERMGCSRPLFQELAGLNAGDCLQRCKRVAAASW